MNEKIIKIQNLKQIVKKKKIELNNKKGLLRESVKEIEALKANNIACFYETDELAKKIREYDVKSLTYEKNKASNLLYKFSEIDELLKNLKLNNHSINNRDYLNIIKENNDEIQKLDLNANFDTIIYPYLENTSFLNNNKLTCINNTNSREYEILVKKISDSNGDLLINGILNKLKEIHFSLDKNTNYDNFNCDLNQEKIHIITKKVYDIRTSIQTSITKSYGVNKMNKDIIQNKIKENIENLKNVEKYNSNITPLINKNVFLSTQSRLINQLESLCIQDNSKIKINRSEKFNNQNYENDNYKNIVNNILSLKYNNNKHNDLFLKEKNMFYCTNTKYLMVLNNLPNFLKIVNEKSEEKVSNLRKSTFKIKNTKSKIEKFVNKNLIANSNLLSELYNNFTKYCLKELSIYATVDLTNISLTTNYNISGFRTYGYKIINMAKYTSLLGFSIVTFLVLNLVEHITNIIIKHENSNFDEENLAKQYILFTEKLINSKLDKGLLEKNYFSKSKKFENKTTNLTDIISVWKEVKLCLNKSLLNLFEYFESLKDIIKNYWINEFYMEIRHKALYLNSK